MPDLTQLYLALRGRARLIVSRLPEPDFYRQEAAALNRSESLFETAPLVADIRSAVAGLLEDDFGHGMLHARKVAVEAGALVCIEAGRLPDRALTRRICLAHCAGLLHDIRRKQPNHAEQSARTARRLMYDRAISSGEIGDVCIAIRNHEAFKPTWAVETHAGLLLSDCLYDADKFRWGPDNFTDTLWAMTAFNRPSLKEFMRRFPRGMESLARIKTTFRSPAGKKYGPQFIDLGIAAGEALYRLMADEFAEGRPDSN
ncbi:MAG: hypothetical protein R6V84_10585 [Desulfobacterales bacterium]